MALYAFVALRYRFPLERIQQTVDRHRAYLRELLAQGNMIASGPFVPREGGGLLLRVEDEAEIQAVEGSQVPTEYRDQVRQYFQP